VEIAGNAETYGLLAITVVVFAVYLARLRTASKPQRRSLAAVRCCSCRRGSSARSPRVS
jgi:hypothetical protein